MLDYVYMSRGGLTGGVGVLNFVVYLVVSLRRKIHNPSSSKQGLLGFRYGVFNCFGRVIIACVIRLLDFQFTAGLL